ncbi:hypothetical protein D9757_012416 [Collybiopsis confluens]|uniref:DUF6532 domain-containing protein n=1 Tax=Collybiopsis confluens TaxID=2823264 RepID=A0A8H5H0U1_9AGAR|nr:hypothetical protein D9757_012416 [Collybiopsis confluens]
MTEPRQKKTVSDGGGVLITGQPGTGKSVSLWYLAVRLLQTLPDDPLVVVRPGITLLFYRGHAFTLRNGKDPRFNPSILPIFTLDPFDNIGIPRCFALYESQPNTDQLDVMASAIPIYAASPGVDNLKHFRSKNLSFVWSLPTWSKEELIEGFKLNTNYLTVKARLATSVPRLPDMPRPYHPSDGPHPAYSDDDDVEMIEVADMQPSNYFLPPTAPEAKLSNLMEAAIREIGWIPRDLFAYMKDIKSIDSAAQVVRQSAADSMLTRDSLARLSTTTNLPSPTIGSYLIHSIFHQHAVMLDADDLNPVEFIISFRSYPAEQEFNRELENRSWDSLASLLQVDPTTRKVIAGNVFEYIAHKQLPAVDNRRLSLFCMVTEEDDKGFCTHRLLANANSVKFITGRREVEPFHRTVLEVVPDTYYWGSRTTPLIDAFFLDCTDYPAGVLYFFQFTISKRKEGKAPGGVELLSHIYHLAVMAATEMRLSSIVVRFVLLQPIARKVVWKLPKFQFPHEVYYCTMHTDRADNHLEGSIWRSCSLLHKDYRGRDRTLIDFLVLESVKTAHGITGFNHDYKMDPEMQPTRRILRQPKLKTSLPTRSMASRKRIKNSPDSAASSKRVRMNIDEALAAFDPVKKKMTRSSTRALQAAAATATTATSTTTATTRSSKPKPASTKPKNAPVKTAPAKNVSAQPPSKGVPEKSQVRSKHIAPPSVVKGDTKQLTSYEPILVEGAPGPENSRKTEAVGMSSYEQDFLNDVVPSGGTIQRSVPVGSNKSSEINTELVETFSEDEEDEDEEDGPDDQMIVEDVTGPEKKKQKRHKGANEKILQNDFENPELARFAKRCARMGTCILNMYPHRDCMFAWKLFSSELHKLAEDGSNEDLLESFLALSADGGERKKLITFMNYGPSGIRWDIAVQVRIRVGQFFGIPGSMSEDAIITAVNWLVKSRNYHHGDIDLLSQTCNTKPFTLPLIGLVLRGYFIDANPEQDQIMLDYLRNLERIPIRLIAMITALIGHALQEYTLGAKTRTDIPLTFKNLSPHYNQIFDTLMKIQVKVPDYIDYLETTLYMDMMTAGAETLPIQTYDYDELNAFALGKKQRKADVITTAPMSVTTDPAVPGTTSEGEELAGSLFEVTGMGEGCECNLIWFYCVQLSLTQKIL